MMCRRVSGEGIVVPARGGMNTQTCHSGSTTSSFQGSDLTAINELKPAHVWGSSLPSIYMNIARVRRSFLRASIDIRGIAH